jgi:hypothetical protein
MALFYAFHDQPMQPPNRFVQLTAFGARDRAFFEVI